MMGSFLVSLHEGFDRVVEVNFSIVPEQMLISCWTCAYFPFLLVDYWIYWIERIERPAMRIASRGISGENDQMVVVRE